MKFILQNITLYVASINILLLIIDNLLVHSNSGHYINVRLL